MNASNRKVSALRIFVDSSGDPLQIYVQDSHKGELDEQLKRYGAAIVPNIQSAKFIIMDLSSELGREFARNYNHPMCKVLDLSWVSACIAEHRLLLENDNWGGYDIQGNGFQNDGGPEHDDQHMPPRIMRNRSWQDPSDPSQSNAPTNTTLFAPTLQASSSTQTSGTTVDPPVQQHPFLNSGFMHSPFIQSGAMIPPSFAFNPQLMQNPNFLMALADVYRNNMSMQMQMNLATFAANAAQQPSPFAAISAPSAPPPSSPHRTEEQLINGRSPTEPPHSSFSRQGKQRDLSSSSTSSSDSPKGKRKASPPPDDEAVGPIFTRNEKNIVFFVQVDLSHRHDLVNKIKEHGGSITNDQDIADLSILSSRSKTFPTLYNNAVKAKTPAITPSFVHDCIQKRKLLPAAPKYLVDAPKQRVTKQASEEGIHKGKPKVEAASKPERKVREQPAVKKRRVSVPKPSLEPKQMNLPPNCPPSPPPPPESTREVQSGRYKYSAAEREYVNTYLKILFERDHEMPMTAVAQKLHQKMPHHPLGSWNTTLGGPLREMLDSARKRAGITHRKNAYNQEKLGPQQATSSDSTKTVEQQRVVDDPRERDLQLVAQFFAEGGAEGVEEDDDRSELWQRLHNKAEWRTADEWMLFYEQEHQEVKRRFSEITGQEAED
ncbi:hypothetical protein GYMLUDRAFT_303036 [Collybiopsis luxurians FD-317 M1]|nr:hypothetical protein GYMLUDRAFT_303036 [Collybiopsis luxurians FD-317 M1]